MCATVAVRLAAVAAVLPLLILQPAAAWTAGRCSPAAHHRSRGAAASRTAVYGSDPSRANCDDEATLARRPRHHAAVDRRRGIQQMIHSTLSIAAASSALLRAPPPAEAYTPDPDPLRESLYLMSRVQEATVQQERFVNRATQQDVLKSKMKLTLRLVEKNYRLLDQITFASEYVTPASKVVDATTAGYEAADALQSAIDYVKSDLRSGDFEEGQKEFLTSNLTECRERLFEFLSYMPQDKLAEARKRVEEGECSRCIDMLYVISSFLIVIVST